MTGRPLHLYRTHLISICTHTLTHIHLTSTHTGHYYIQIKRDYCFAHQLLNKTIRSRGTQTTTLRTHTFLHTNFESSQQLCVSPSPHTVCTRSIGLIKAPGWFWVIENSAWIWLVFPEPHCTHACLTMLGLAAAMSIALLRCSQYEEVVSQDEGEGWGGERRLGGSLRRSRVLLRYDRHPGRVAGAGTVLWTPRKFISLSPRHSTMA